MTHGGAYMDVKVVDIGKLFEKVDKLHEVQHLIMD